VGSVQGRKDETEQFGHETPNIVRQAEGNDCSVTGALMQRKRYRNSKLFCPKGH
jgi:hypothetical protein